MIANGADVNLKTTHGSFPLYHVAFFGILPAMNHVIHNGSDVNLRDKLGNTAMHASTVRKFGF